ncbi:MAG: radical SAM protein [Candidatus Aminicenantales bacterium]
MSKNILLINPWIYDFTAYDFWLKPLGLLYIAAILQKYTKTRIHFIDCLSRHHPLLEKKTKSKPDGRGPFPKEEVEKPQVLKKVPRRYSRYGIPVTLFLQELERVPLPDLVLLTGTMTYWYPGVQMAIELVRKKFGSVPVVLGGIYASLMGEHARRFSGADEICQGPGENKILPLVRKYLGDGAAEAAEFSTLDDLPHPAHGRLRSQEFLPLLTSRGCPFRCTFCASPILNEKFEQRKPSSVVAEITENFYLYKTRHLVFYDDALLLNREAHIVPILKGILRERLPLSCHTPNGLHVREVNDEIACLFRQAGVRSLYLSQESADAAVLRDSCPKVSPEDLEKALASLEKAGFRRPDINVYLIAGLPGQDPAGIRESICHVFRLGAKPRLAYYSPIPGTPLWSDLVAQGYFRPDADPLLHNKLTFPYLWGNFFSSDFESLRHFAE